MRYWIAALLLVAAGPALSQDNPWNCDAPGELPQQAMNMCAFEDWQEADQELNEAWPKVRKWARERDDNLPDLSIRRIDSTMSDSLLKAQRAWIDYRDGHCETEGLRYAGGSIVPLIVNSCKADMTRKRTEELLLLLEEG
ncbi:MAG: lysozyme inhibitor LprI family protein [Pseudomonadota bacterium]